MLNWYIETNRTDKDYFDRVKSTVEEFMDYFCEKISLIR